MRCFFTSLLVFALVALAPIPAFSETQSRLNDKEFQVNRGGNINPLVRLGTAVYKRRLYAVRAQYDFSKSGGAISTIKLLDEVGQPVILPKSAIVRDCIIDVTTVPVGAGGTIAFSTGKAANDLKTATAVASITGLVACVPVGTAATAIKITADVTPTIVIATTALTAGKFSVLIDYEMGE